MAKNLVSGPIFAHLTQIRATNFFFKILAPSDTRYHCQLSSCTVSEKTNDPILRKLSDGQTDGRTDWQTDECDFTRRCPTNVERPTSRLDSLIQIICLTVALRTRKVCSDECYRRIKRNFSRKHRGSFI